MVFFGIYIIFSCYLTTTLYFILSINEMNIWKIGFFSIFWHSFTLTNWFSKSFCSCINCFRCIIWKNWFILVFGVCNNYFTFLFIELSNSILYYSYTWYWRMILYSYICFMMWNCCFMDLFKF